MFYILPKEIYRQHHENPFGTHFGEAHALDLPTGHVLLRASFANQTKLRAFESHSQVICLPHAFSGRPIGEKAESHVAHWGLNRNHTTFDVAEKAAAEHSVFALRHW